MEDTVFDRLYSQDNTLFTRIFSGEGTDADFLLVSINLINRMPNKVGSALCCTDKELEDAFLSKLPDHAFRRIPELMAMPAISFLQRCLTAKPSITPPQDFYTLENFLLSGGFLSYEDAGKFLAKLPEIPSNVFHQMGRAHFTTYNFYQLTKIFRIPGVIEKIILDDEMQGLPEKVIKHIVYNKLVDDDVSHARASLMADLVAQGTSISDAKLALGIQ